MSTPGHGADLHPKQISQFIDKVKRFALHLMSKDTVLGSFHTWTMSDSLPSALGECENNHPPQNKQEMRVAVRVDVTQLNVE